VLFIEPLDLKRSKVHIFCAWLLLLFFVAGQSAVFAHQHHVNHPTGKAGRLVSTQTVTEKCQLCDAMHVSMALPDVHYHPALVYIPYQYPVTEIYGYLTISLILASGRAPPADQLHS
jgi:hypothetical protein